MQRIETVADFKRKHYFYFPWGFPNTSLLSPEDIQISSFALSSMVSISHDYLYILLSLSYWLSSCSLVSLTGLLSPASLHFIITIFPLCGSCCIFPLSVIALSLLPANCLHDTLCVTSLLCPLYYLNGFSNFAWLQLLNMLKCPQHGKNDS